MTNQYEDFAESFVYFILHNEAFLERSQSSSLLAQKYAFFKRYLFFGSEFEAMSFSSE